MKIPTTGKELAGRLQPLDEERQTGSAMHKSAKVWPAWPGESGP